MVLVWCLCGLSVVLVWCKCGLSVVIAVLYIITYRIVLVEWVTELLKGIEELDIILGFICSICYLCIQLLPHL